MILNPSVDSSNDEDMIEVQQPLQAPPDSAVAADSSWYGQGLLWASSSAGNDLGEIVQIFIA